MTKYQKVTISYDGTMYTVNGRNVCLNDNDFDEVVEFLLYLTTEPMERYRFVISEEARGNLKQTHESILEKIVDVNGMVNSLKGKIEENLSMREQWKKQKKSA